MMSVYSAVMSLALFLTAPWWLWRMATSGRYRAGLGQRLGLVPDSLRAAVAGKPVVWVHAVSVGEVLAAARLIAELGAALPGYVVVVSTTTKTAQELARTRLPRVPVFYLPLDFAWAIRRYLRVLQPKLLVLMESELWPRLLVECERNGTPVAVVNARVSDRSFPRYMRLRWLWKPLLAKVTVFLAQSEETAERLRRMGVPTERVRCPGNLKYDIRAPGDSRMAEEIRKAAGGRPIIVAGSTVGGELLDEEMAVIQAWEGVPRREFNELLVLAPRHPERFGVVESVVAEFHFRKASCWGADEEGTPPCAMEPREDGASGAVEVVLLDTIGDLAAVYAIADIAFVGGSLLQSGGHNPLEPARFGVPVVMGPSFENFREIVANMLAVDGIRIVPDQGGLEAALTELRTDREAARAMGERGRLVFEAQSGATGRTVEALLGLLQERGV